MPKNSSGFAFSQLIGCVLLAMTAALLLVSRSTVEMALESSILSLPQPLADGVQSIQSPTILLKWHQNLVDEGEENFVGDSEIIALGGASNETKDRPLG